MRLLQSQLLNLRLYIVTRASWCGNAELGGCYRLIHIFAHADWVKGEEKMPPHKFFFFIVTFMSNEDFQAPLG